MNPSEAVTLHPAAGATSTIVAFASGLNPREASLHKRL